MQYAIDYPEFLDQQVTYHGEFDNIKNVSSKSQPKKEETYTIDKLLWYTFTYSDNVSLNLIQAQLEEKYPGSLNKAKIDFNMPLSRDDSLIKIIPYAQTFEALYTSSCLSQDMSEKALSFLTEASFNEGISEPLDPSIPIANKFGYRIHDFGNLNELHDCGIVYKPQNPYLICVMTKGKSKTIQASAISKISKTIWDHLDR